MVCIEKATLTTPSTVPVIRYAQEGTHNITDHAGDQLGSCELYCNCRSFNKGVMVRKTIILTLSVRRGFNVQPVTEYVTTYQFQLYREVYKYKLLLN